MKIVHALAAESPINCAHTTPESSPRSVTAVSCVPSFVDKSAIFPWMAKCAVIADLVAPAETPHTDLHKVDKHVMYKNHELGKTDVSISTQTHTFAIVR